MMEKDNFNYYNDLFRDLRDKKIGSFLILIKLYKGQYLNLCWAILFFVIKHSPVWAIPVVTAQMVNIVSDPENNDLTWLWINLAIISFLIVQNIGTQYAHIYYMSIASRKVEADLRMSMIQKLQQLSMVFHSDSHSGKLQTKLLRDVEAIESITKQLFISFVPTILNVIVSITVTIFLNWLVAVFFIIVCPIALSLVYLFRGKIKKHNHDFRVQTEDIFKQISETIEMIPVTRAHGLEKVERSKLSKSLKHLQEKGLRLDLIGALFGASSWTVFTLFQMFCLAFTCVLAYEGRIQVGDIIMYQGFFTAILMSINQIIHVYPYFAKGLESVHSIKELLSSEQIEEYVGDRVLEPIVGSFTFQNVVYHYPNMEQNSTLKGFDLHIRPGECVALVGPSGAGKSTILNMLVGFYRPTSGRILLDDQPFDELDMQSYRQKIAVVPQNIILFSGSIRENIVYGLSDVDEAKLQHVIDAAKLRDVIEMMPDGLETMIGEHGAKLSGGQRQRIAIARALIRDPQVILLDEATSALDNASEHSVQIAMKQMLQGRTTVIVAHRLSTIRDADRIVFVKEGRVAEVGTFQQLMALKGHFYHLQQMQRDHSQEILLT